MPLGCVEQAYNRESFKDKVTGIALAVAGIVITMVQPELAPIVAGVDITVAVFGEVEPVHEGDVFMTDVSIDAKSLD